MNLACKRIKTLQNKKIVDCPNGESLTTSIVVSEIQIDDTLDTLIRRADDAIYRAKCEGVYKIKASNEKD